MLPDISDFSVMSISHYSPGNRHNARHHPPRIQPRYGQVSRMKAPLFAVECMPLLGRAPLLEFRCFHLLQFSHGSNMVKPVMILIVVANTLPWSSLLLRVSKNSRLNTQHDV